ncbi:MAG: mce related protein [Planctomycetaceae bacterium]|nr:mce related protein [Planctomycetaceae bacterium]
MMSEGQLQFRVGMFVIIAMLTAMGLVLRFGEMKWMWEEYYTIAVHFDEAPGVHPQTGVRKNGVPIGHVRELFFDDKQGGVTALLNIQKRHTLRKDSKARLSVSLLGDATVEFTPGTSKEILSPASRIEGDPSPNPMEMISRMQVRVDETLASFASTSREWQKVAKNVNGVMETHRGNIGKVVEEAAESMHELTLTLKAANSIVGDPQTQEGLRDTLAAMPDMVRETQAAIKAIRGAIGKADQALGNIAQVTGPLAERSESISASLDKSLINVELLLTDLSKFSRLMTDENGSLKMLATDPELYRNLNRSAGSLSTLLANLQPVMEDIRVLSDKLARHPELLGVRGAIQGSTGLKTPDEAPTKQPVRQASPNKSGVLRQ